MKKILTKEQWINNLTSACSAYGKSYKLYGNWHKVMQIVEGLIGSAAVLAVVPAMPVFIASISVAPDIIGVITNVIKMWDKNNFKISS